MFLSLFFRLCELLFTSPNQRILNGKAVSPQSSSDTEIVHLPGQPASPVAKGNFWQSWHSHINLDGSRVEAKRQPLDYTCRSWGRGKAANTLSGSHLHL
jgi:hypothetical protein